MREIAADVKDSTVLEFIDQGSEIQIQSEDPNVKELPAEINQSLF